MTLPRSILLSLPLQLLVVGCSAPDDSGAPAGKVATEATAPSSSSAPVWKASSKRVELSRFGFWSGSTGYAKDRTELTAEQLAALDGLRTTTPDDRVMADGESYELRVIDEDGTIARYRAAQGNVRDSDEAADAASLPTIDVATLKPFVATVRCLSAREVTPISRTTDAPLDPSSADMSKAVALPTDTGCVNGAFVPYACSDSVLTLDVGGPTTYELSSERCLERLSLRVYADDRTTLVAESQPAADGCFTLKHAFAAGSYVLVLGKTNQSGCAASGSAGDVRLRLRTVE